MGFENLFGDQHLVVPSASPSSPRLPTGRGVRSGSGRSRCPGKAPARSAAAGRRRRGYPHRRCVWGGPGRSGGGFRCGRWPNGGSGIPKGRRAWYPPSGQSSRRGRRAGSRWALKESRPCTHRRSCRRSGRRLLPRLHPADGGENPVEGTFIDPVVRIDNFKKLPGGVPKPLVDTLAVAAVFLVNRFADAGMLPLVAGRRSCRSRPWSRRR